MEHSIPRAADICQGFSALNEDQLREIADIKYESKVPAEGIVIRDFCSTWSFKVINLNFKDKL